VSYDVTGNHAYMPWLQLQAPIVPVSLANKKVPELTGSRAETSIMDSLFGTGEAAERMATKET